MSWQAGRQRMPDQAAKRGDDRAHRFSKFSSRSLTRSRMLARILVLRGLQSCLSCSAPPDNSGLQQCNRLMGNAKHIVCPKKIGVGLGCSHRSSIATSIRLMASPSTLAFTPEIISFVGIGALRECYPVSYLLIQLCSTLHS